MRFPCRFCSTRLNFSLPAAQLLEATEARAAVLGQDNVRLREQLHDMRTEFEQLLSR